MAVSGTISTTTFNTLKVCERAFGRCKIEPQKITAEKLEIARQLLWLWMSNLANQGAPLWCIDKEVITLTAADYEVETPIGTVDILNANLQQISNSYEIPLARINRDDYTSLPNKTQEGRPVQYWLDRQRVRPVMMLWPAPSASIAADYQIVIWRHRQLMDVGALSQELEFPQRWYEAVVANLAAKLADEFAEVPFELAMRLEAKAAAALTEAQGEERDNSPINWAPRIGMYTA